LILKTIYKLVATRCHRPILKLKCTKFDFGWSSAPDPARETYSAPPDPLAGLRGLLLMEGRGGRTYGWKGKGGGGGDLFLRRGKKKRGKGG